MSVLAAEGVAAEPRDAVRAAIEALGGQRPHSVVVFAALHGDPFLAVRAAAEVAGDAELVGCVAPGVLHGEGESEAGPAAVALAVAGGPPWRTAHRLPGAPVEPGPGLTLVFADGHSARPTDLDASIAGGVATAVDGLRPAYRFLGRAVFEEGLVSLALGEQGLVDVAQGVSPVGATHEVTAVNGRVVEALDGAPAFAAFAAFARPLLDDLPRAAQAVLVAEAEPADPSWERYALHGLLGFDPERGLLATSHPLSVGTKLRFAVRDPALAREHLRAMTLRVRDRLEGRPPRYGFYFNGAGRGRSLYGVPDHDTAFIQGTLGRFPMIGFTGGGEIATSRYHLHSGVLAVMP